MRHNPIEFFSLFVGRSNEMDIRSDPDILLIPALGSEMCANGIFADIRAIEPGSENGVARGLGCIVES